MMHQMMFSTWLPKKPGKKVGFFRGFKGGLLVSFPCKDLFSRSAAADWMPTQLLVFRWIKAMIDLIVSDSLIRHLHFRESRFFFLSRFVFFL